MYIVELIPTVLNVFLSLQQWKKIPKSGSWPLGRKRHAACCLNYGQQNPQVLMAGGVDENGTQLRDMWLLDVDAGKWTKVGGKGERK